MTKTLNLKKHGIKLIEENKDLIESVLKSVNGRASQYTTTTYEEVLKFLEKGKAKVKAAKLRKKDLKDIEIVSYGFSPPSGTRKYPGRALVTQIYFKMFHDGWRLVCVEKWTMFDDNKRAGEVSLIRRLTPAKPVDAIS